MGKLRYRDIKFLAQKHAGHSRAETRRPFPLLRLQGESLEGYKIHSVLLMEGAGHHIPSAAASERLHLQIPGSRAQLLVVCVSQSESSICSEEQGRAKQEKRVSCFLPPAPLQIGSRESSPQHRGSSQGSSSSLIIIPPGCLRAQQQSPPWGQHVVAGGSKAEEKPLDLGEKETQAASPFPMT